MEKKQGKKVVLSREILRELNREEIRQAGGGWYTDSCDTCACNG